MIVLQGISFFAETLSYKHLPGYITVIYYSINCWHGTRRRWNFVSTIFCSM